MSGYLFSIFNDYEKSHQKEEMVVRKITILEERVRINELAQAGYTDREIAQQIGCSLWTVRKWRRRFRDQGRQALASEMGRPAAGFLSTYPAVIRETLHAWRKAHPGWGAKTLWAELAGDERRKEQKLPSQRSIGRFLEAEGLTRSYERHSELPQSVRSAPQAPHEEWELDARGHEYVPDVGVIMLIDLKDCYSRIRLLSYPCWLGAQRMERRAATEDYKLVLRLAFTDWGLPDRIAVDHDRIFYDGGSKSSFPTQLHLWLLALGVSLVFGRFHCPTDQSHVERSHQTWAQQVLTGQRFDNWQALHQALCQRRDFLNTQLPCASLGEVPPLVAYPEARTPRRPYRPEWETELLDVSRVCAYLAQGRWFRLASNVGAVSLGGQVYVLGHSWAKQQVEVKFNATDQQMVFHSEDGGELSKSLPVKGITPNALTGEMGPLINFPAFQLALPFTWDEWRGARLCGIIGGTT